MNKKLFSTETNKLTVNNAGGAAYNKTDKHALAQLAVTNCFNSTFYQSEEQLLNVALEACAKLENDPEFIAKVAVYSRKQAHMKDFPAFLLVYLSKFDVGLFHKVFDIVVDNGKILRNVVQMARSGAVTGKKENMSSGKWRTALNRWFNSRRPESVFKANIGNDPKLSDVVKMARPKPATKELEATLGYIIGKEYNFDLLPKVIKDYEVFKKNPKEAPVPDVDFRLLDSLNIDESVWVQIAKNANWQMARMNINTFNRHGVFKSQENVKMIADKIRDPQNVLNAKAFPYQLFAAYLATKDSGHALISNALQEAMEVAIQNVPVFEGRGVVAVDNSGSMSCPVTGHRKGSTTSVSCSDAAGLIASAIARKNKSARIYSFNTQAKYASDVNPFDSVMTNIQKLNRYSGGTDCSCVLKKLNADHDTADWVIIVSDNESWYRDGWQGTKSTALMHEWKKFATRNPNAKLFLIDLSPNITSQALPREDIFQIGGFSDKVFDFLGATINHQASKDAWVEMIESISLN